MINANVQSSTYMQYADKILYFKKKGHKQIHAQEQGD